MADIKTKYGADGQTITITLASLANNAARQSNVVTNTDLFLDVLVQVQLRSGASGVSSTGFVNVWAYASVDDGTTYSDGATGSDSAITLTNPPNMRLIGVINVVANNVLYRSTPMSVAAVFGGALPKKWGIVIENRSGAAFGSSGSDFFVKMQGVFTQVN